MAATEPSTSAHKPAPIEVAQELAALSIGTCTHSLSALDRAIEAHLSRVDDISAQLDATRSEVATTVDSGYPALLENTRELIKLFSAIERTEEAVERVANATQAAANRLEVLQKANDAKHPEGISLFASWLGARKSAALDAPVTLPPWNPSSTVIDADAEITALRAVLGSPPLHTAAVASAAAAAAVAPPSAGAIATSGRGAAAASVGAEEPVATTSSGGGGGGGSGSDAVAHSAPAVAVAATAVDDAAEEEGGSDTAGATPTDAEASPAAAEGQREKGAAAAEEIFSGGEQAVEAEVEAVVTAAAAAAIGL